MNETTSFMVAGWSRCKRVKLVLPLLLFSIISIQDILFLTFCLRKLQKDNFSNPSSAPSIASPQIRREMQVFQPSDSLELLKHSLIQQSTKRARS